MTNQEKCNFKNEIKFELKDIENVIFSKISNIKHGLSNNAFFVTNRHYNSMDDNEYIVFKPNQNHMPCIIWNKQRNVEKTILKVSV